METKKNQNKKKEIESLNSVFDESMLQELEQRLETDPLVGGSVFDLASDSFAEPLDGCTFCAACNIKE